MKTLYFEGAGCVPRGEVENCRIRTAYRNKHGEIVYLEIMGNDRAYLFGTDGKGGKKAIQIFGAYGWIDFAFKTKPQQDKDGKVYWTDCNVMQNRYEYNRHASEHVNYTFEYTKAEILRMVNTYFDGDFTAIEVLPDLAGYRVHKDVKKACECPYNLMDDFYYDKARTAQAERIKQYLTEKEKARGEKYARFSIWFENDVLKVRFFDGRGTLEIADVYAFNFGSNKA